MPWRPGQHDARLQLEQPYEDVPPHILVPLVAWLTRWIALHSSRLQPLLIRMRLDGYGYTGNTNQLNKVLRALGDDAKGDSDLLFNLVENFLDLLPQPGEAARHLESILLEGNSMYRVRADLRGLELRIAPEVRELVESTVTAASHVNSSGQHLAAAWNAVYGRSPDPVKGYSESIKAVEAAAAPVLSLDPPIIGEVEAREAGCWRARVV